MNERAGEQMKGGWAKFYDRILDWRWYTDGNTFRLFFHLIMTASHKDKPWKDIVVRRGQRIASYDSLAEELQLSQRQIRTALEHLKSTGEVTSKTTSGFTVLTVENYSNYQNKDQTPTSKATSNLTSDRQGSDKAATSDRQHRNNINNINNVNKREAPLAFLFFGEYGNVQLTEEQHAKFLAEYPDIAAEEIERLSSYMTETGKTYASHIAVLRKWAKEDAAKAKAEPEKFADLTPLYEEYLRKKKEQEAAQ